MRQITCTLESAVHACDGNTEDPEHVAVKLLPVPTFEVRLETVTRWRAGERVEVTRPQRYATTQPSAITQTVNASVLPRHRKLSDLCGVQLLVTIDDAGIIERVEYAP